MLDKYRKLAILLTPKELRTAILLLPVLVGLAAVETVGVFVFMPFLAVAANPELTVHSPFIAALFRFSGADNHQGFMLRLATGVLLLYMLISTYRALAHYALYRFINMRRSSIARRLLANYLHQPYQFFLGRHSAAMTKSVLTDVDYVTSNVLKPLGNMIAFGLVAIAILILLFSVNPVAALMMGGGIGGLYGLVYFFAHTLLGNVGRERQKANQGRFKTLTELVGGIKEIKLRGLEDAYLDRFISASRTYSNRQAVADSISNLPRILLELLALAVLFGVAIYLVMEDDNFANTVPLLGLYAVAGYRLIPAMHQIYLAASTLQVASAPLDAICRDLSMSGKAGAARGEQRLLPRERISISGMGFRYAKAKQDALREVSLEIPANATIALVGGTGAGKTTLVDLLLGLLPPTRGEIRVDGVLLDKVTLPAWQNAIGYVPQQIYLSDTSIAENIALGLKPEEIDAAALERAARAANIHEFIVQELPEGYQTKVGERGVRLSGGQIQRIGIARALYRDPAVLVMDEATSALDTVTEQAVIAAIRAMKGSKTVILVAHRLSTAMLADTVVVMRNGEIAGMGDFDTLAAQNDVFRELVRAGHIAEPAQPAAGS
jgi:ABC-type multidrug transport system fused ATPase/permease subunit